MTLAEFRRLLPPLFVGIEDTQWMRWRCYSVPPNVKIFGKAQLANGRKEAAKMVARTAWEINVEKGGDTAPAVLGL